MKKQQNEELKRLENDLKANGKLDEAAKRIAAEGKAQSDGEIMVTAAKELGYDISVTALEQARADAEPVPHEALAEATGGEKHYHYCEPPHQLRLHSKLWQRDGR